MLEDVEFEALLNEGSCQIQEKFAEQWEWLNKKFHYASKLWE